MATQQGPSDKIGPHREGTTDKFKTRRWGRANRAPTPRPAHAAPGIAGRTPPGPVRCNLSVAAPRSGLSQRARLHGRKAAGACTCGDQRGTHTLTGGAAAAAASPASFAQRERRRASPGRSTAMTHHRRPRGRAGALAAAHAPRAAPQYSYARALNYLQPTRGPARNASSPVAAAMAGSANQCRGEHRPLARVKSRGRLSEKAGHTEGCHMEAGPAPFPIAHYELIDQHVALPQ